MTNATHTPGPWYRDEDGFIVAGHGDSYVTVASPNCGALDIDEREANACLIAAAPEMLTMLSDIRHMLKLDSECFGYDGGWDETIKELDVLIAKATGGK